MGSPLPPETHLQLTFLKNPISLTLAFNELCVFQGALGHKRGFPDIRLQCRRPHFDSWVGKICWRRDRLPNPVFLGFPCGSAGKESACNVGDLVQTLGWKDPLEKEKANPLQYSGLENSVDCIVRGFTKSRT